MTTTATTQNVIPEASRGMWNTSYLPEDFTVPTGREENWRFTPVRSLKSVLKGAANTGKLETNHDIPEGVFLEDSDTTHSLRGCVPEPADRAAALAYAGAEVVTVITIPKELECTEPIRLRFNGSGQTTHQHLVVNAEAFSKATIVIEYTGTATLTELVSVNVQDSSQITIASLQTWADDAVHLSQHDVVVGRDAHANHVAVTLGGSIVRLSANAHYAGPGGIAQLNGMYFSDDTQHLEHRTFADHTQPNCTSDVLYKGALQGNQARSVWVGDVLIRKEATGTETYELNRNLLLTPGARADSIPNLEIETGEIAGAGHASTTGNLDENHLFYLQARGIPEELARKIVLRGYFEEIANRIGVTDVIDSIMAIVDEELALGESA